MEIYEITIRVLMFLISGYTLVKFGQRYFVQLTNFMFNTPTTWNKYLDKPRLYIYFFGVLFMIFSFNMFKSATPMLSIRIELIQLLYFSLFLMGSLFCHFTWTKKFRKAFIQTMQKKLNPVSKLKPTIKDLQKIKEIFNRIKSEGYFDGKLSSFENLIRLEPIISEDRINWIDKSPTNKKNLNRQTLFELLSNLFIGFESLKTKEISTLCNRYFHDGGSEITISSKNVWQWNHNKAPYLRKISDIIKG